MATKRCPVDQAQPGMLLGQPILDDKGRTIVPAGSRLTPAHIKRLDRWGIDHITITDEDSETALSRIREEEGLPPEKPEIEQPSGEDRDKMRRIAEAIQERFSDIKDNPLMEKLKLMAVRHLVVESKEGDIPGVHYDN